MRTRTIIELNTTLVAPAHPVRRNAYRVKDRLHHPKVFPLIAHLRHAGKV